MLAKLGALTFLLVTLFMTCSALECYKCRSDITADCATDPGMQMDVKKCLDTDKCVVAVINGVTHRNCLSTLLPNKYCAEPLCSTCSTNLCNANVFPADRLRCYQCAGKECLNVTTSKLKPLACREYLEKDRCFTNINAADDIERGCVSKNAERCTNICLKCNYSGCNSETGV